MPLLQNRVQTFKRKMKNSYIFVSVIKNSKSMKSIFLRNCLLSVVFVFLLVVMYSCANMSSPNGGPYDELPPVVVKTIPKPNQTNFKGKRIEIEFNEIIQLDKPMENVIITPPQQQLPVIRANGKKIIVELKDTLKENTTYTVDFTSSISDNNEKNIFENYSFAFSTGAVLDTLEVSGTLLDASNLEPLIGITIGLHDNLTDTAFTKIPFVRTSRTNERGQFTIRNMAPGTYKVFALNDVNRDYKFDQAGEDIAFRDSTIVPTFTFSSRQDTIWKDTLTIDTIKTVNYTKFLPNDIELFLFKEEFKRQYMLKPERLQENKFTVRFNAPIDSLPLLKPINFEPKSEDWVFVQNADENKSIHYWITDSLIFKQDTLSMSVEYLKSDSLNVLRPQVDTLSLVMKRRPKEKRKKKKDDKPEPIPMLNITSDAPSKMDMFDTVRVTFDEPVYGLTKEQLYLDIKKDTIWESVDYEIVPDSLNSLSYLIMRPWKYGEAYRLEIDSATVKSVYGKLNNKLSNEFTLKAREEYGHLYINTPGVDSLAFVEILDKNDTPVRKSVIKDGGTLFMNLPPNKYYARLVIDTNGNNKWDTGNYALGIQPEEVIYYPNVFDISVNFEIEQTWDTKALPAQKQKPMDITKNKPKEIVKKKRDHRNEGKQSSSNSNGMGSIPGL